MFNRHLRTLFCAAGAYFAILAAYVFYLERAWPGVLVHAIYDASTLGFPTFLVGVVGVRWLGGRRMNRGALALALLLFGIRVYATHIEPNTLKVRRVTIASTKVTRPLRIAHISDIQSDGIGAHERRVLATLAMEAPDLVIHTGDILQTNPPTSDEAELAKLEPLLKDVEAPLGRFHVTGDTDWRISHLYDTFEGFQTLDDEGLTLYHGEDRIRLYGVDVDTARRPQEAAIQIAKWRAEDPTALNIVYAHPPDFILGLADEPVDLALAGHTHGGQIRLPWFGPLVTGTEVPRALARGFHKVHDTWLNTSAGIGAEHIFSMPSLRINCPPEFTIITVVPKVSTEIALLEG